MATQHDPRLREYLAASEPPPAHHSLPPGKQHAPVPTLDRHVTRWGDRAKAITAIIAALFSLGTVGALGETVARRLLRTWLGVDVVAGQQTGDGVDLSGVKALVAAQAERTSTLEDDVGALQGKVAAQAKAITQLQPKPVNPKQLRVTAPAPTDGTFIRADGGVRASPFAGRQ